MQFYKLPCRENYYLTVIQDGALREGLVLEVGVPHFSDDDAVFLGRRQSQSPGQRHSLLLVKHFRVYRGTQIYRLGRGACRVRDLEGRCLFCG